MLYGRQEIRLPIRTLRDASANGYVIAQVQCANKLSVRVVFTVTAIWPCLHLSRHVANCLGVIWSSLTGN